MDPTVEEAIQRLRKGNASPEDAKLAFENGYQGGPETQKYYQELGLIDPPQDTVPQDAAPVQQSASNTTADLERAKGEAHAKGNLYYQPEQFKPTEQSTERKIPDFSKLKDTEAFERGMQAWSPLAPSMIKSGDMSGFASGERSKANIYDQNATQNAKILQWSRQRAADERTADKIAAAQANEQWKQNADALGAEGGAAVVASQNKAVTPDLQYQKSFQTEQMNNAKQSLAEVNRNKLEANAARQNAAATDYNTVYNESRDAYATNLATAKSAQDNKDTTKETKSEETATPEQQGDNTPGSKENTETEQQTTATAAETNKQSNATETATQEVSAEQKKSDILKQFNTLNAELPSATNERRKAIRDDWQKYTEQYLALGGDSKDIPDMWLPSSTNTQNIVSAINDITL